MYCIVYMSLMESISKIVDWVGLAWENQFINKLPTLSFCIVTYEMGILNIWSTLKKMIFMKPHRTNVYKEFLLKFWYGTPIGKVVFPIWASCKPLLASNRSDQRIIRFFATLCEMEEWNTWEKLAISCRHFAPHCSCLISVNSIQHK